MSSFFKLAAWMLLQSSQAGKTRLATIRMIVAVLCWGFACVSLLAALGCAAAALWILTLPALGPIGAPLIVAATFSVMALVLAASGWRFGLRRSRAAVTPQVLQAELTRTFVENKAAVLLMALFAGMAAENSGRKK
jgi:hypothetical protein